MFNKLKKRKSNKQSPEIKCPECGKIISSESVIQAEKQSKKKLEESMKKFGTISVKAEWEIQCNHCGNRILYYPHNGKIKEKGK